MVFKKERNQRKLVPREVWIQSQQVPEEVGRWYHQVENHPSCSGTVWLLRVSVWVEESRVASLQNPGAHTPNEDLQRLHTVFQRSCSAVVGGRRRCSGSRWRNYRHLSIYGHKHSKLEVLTLDNKVIVDCFLYYPELLVYRFSLVS